MCMLDLLLCAPLGNAGPGRQAANARTRCGRELLGRVHIQFNGVKNGLLAEGLANHPPARDKLAYRGIGEYAESR